MQRFKNILVLCEEESHHDLALRRAAWLAERNKARVTLMDVVEARPGELARLFAALPGARSQEIEDQVLDIHRDRLEKLAAPMRDRGIEVQTTVQQGTAFLHAIRQVLRGGHDLVLKGVHTGQGGTAVLFRGYDLHLMRKCPCPVWIVKGDADGAIGRIGAAVDPDPTNEVGEKLNRVVMELSTSLAQWEEADLHIINAWRLQEESSLRHSRVSMPEHEIEMLVEHERVRSQAELDKLVEAFADRMSNPVIAHPKGAPGAIIPDYVVDHGIDTLVMGTVGRTGISGLFIGNTAETILSRVDCSVITVKPPGFVTPVELENGEQT